AVFEEFVAPRVEQRAVRRAGDLHTLRDEAGEADALRGVGVGVVVAASRVGDDVAGGDRATGPERRHDAALASPTVAAGVKVTSEVQSGSSSSAVAMVSVQST